MARFRTSWPLYAAAAAVLVVSVLAAWQLPIDAFFKGVMSFPAMAAMLAFLAQVWRDQLAYERQQALQGSQQDFTLGVASHMAEVAYTKHLEFCEAYSQKVNEGLHKLVELGPSEYALQLSAELFIIRSTYTVWLSEEIEQQLSPFERALRKIGADMRVATHTPPNTARSELLNAVMDPYLLVIGEKSPGSEEEAEKTVRQALENLRKLLGTRELTILRDVAIAAAKARITSEARGH